MFLASHICWVSSGTVRARYCWDPLEVSGAKPTMKKWRRGKGIKLTASLRRSEFSCPGKRRQHVTPLMVAEIRWFRSPKWVWRASECGSRCHIELHCQVPCTHRHSQQADGQIVWHCKVPPRYQKPLVRGKLRMSTSSCPGTPP
ncbi:Os02g0167366 [Oryza sativa Japonica Group]|uniref:Os02g0167366 protein n=1 Tax=Oryza sativa subsp. japonica TaxID=39947 RepID=A0A0P0VFB4_ORYSJ|nr:Os02g0167366 [Oryza sativa Japonica Group]